MKTYYSDTEIKNKLKELVVICDTREQRGEHITEYLDKKKIPYITRALETGDYSAMLGNQTLEGEVIIERKGSLNELVGNFTADRERFEREFLRAKANGIKIYLVIEDCSWCDVVTGNYTSKTKPASAVASLISWSVRYNVTVFFTRKADSGHLIYSLLYYTAREALK